MSKLNKLYVLLALISVLVIICIVSIIPYIQMSLNNLQQLSSAPRLQRPPLMPMQNQPPPVKTAPTPPPATKVDIDPEIGKFEYKVNQLLLAKDFEKLDKMAHEFRISKEHFKSGSWKINVLYYSLATIYETASQKSESDSAWKEKIALFESWKKNYPQSPTARIGLARVYVNYGWFARGEGYANTVLDKNIELLNERLDLAEKELEEARQLPEKCPQWYAGKLFIAMVTGVPIEKFEALFREAIRFEPTYFPYYVIMSDRLTPKWGGSIEQWQAYLEAIPQIVTSQNSDEGNIIYLITITGKMDGESVISDYSKLSKERIRQGYADLCRKYGGDDYILNRYARLLTYTLDFPTVNEALEQIGNNPNPKVWSAETYNYAKKEREEMFKEIQEMCRTNPCDENYELISPEIRFGKNSQTNSR